MSSCSSCSAPNPTPSCPIRMSDGRVFTDYRPRCAVNAELMQLVSAQKMMESSYESRMFLQQNAEQMIQMERDRSIKRMVPCAPCERPLTDQGTLLPERYVVRCNGVSCARNEVNPEGVGDRRDFTV